MIDKHLSDFPVPRCPVCGTPLNGNYCRYSYRMDHQLEAPTGYMVVDPVYQIETHAT